MKKIKIKCLLCDSLDIYKYHIYMYDCDGRLVEDTETKQGCALLNVERLGLYKIIIIPKGCLLPCRIVKCIYINNDITNFLFTFNKFVCKRHSIIVRLTDKHYKGLSVAKGEMHLWKIKL